MHLIENPQVFADLDHTSALNSDWDFFMFLFEKGRETAEKWLAKNYDDIGTRSTANLSEEFV
jgi:NTE family protein